MKRTSILLFLGWMFHMLSITLLTWDTGNLQLARDLSLSHPGALQAVFLAGYCLGFLSAVLVGLLRRRSIGSMVLVLASLLMMIFGLVFLHAPSQGMIALRICGALLCGTGSAAAFVLWQRAFSQDSLQLAARILTIASACSTVLFLGFSVSPLMAYPEFFACASGAVSVILAVPYFKRAPQGEFAATDAASIRGFFARLWRSVACVAFFAFVWELTTSFVVFQVDAAAQMRFVYPVANLCGIALFLFVWVRLKSPINLDNVYLALFPLMATGFLLLPFFGAGYQKAFAAVACGVFVVLSILMQVICIQEHKRSGVDPMIPIGLFAGIVYAFMTAGFCLGRSLTTAGGVDSTRLLVIALILVYLLALIMFSFFMKKGSRPVGQESGEEVQIKTTAVNETLDDKRLALSRDRGLSEREMEVLILLLKGRNLPFISEELCISKNTVKSHCRNIYRKFSVHSRQELLDVFESSAQGEE